MGSGSVTLGGTLLTAPSTFSRERESVGDAHHLADGSEHWDHLAYKHRWQLGWRSLTGAERGTLAAVFLTSGTVTLNDWDGTAGIVIPARHPLRETPRYLGVSGGTTYYDCTWTLQEV